MPPSTTRTYRAATRLAVGLLPLAALFSDKIRRGVTGRRGGLERLRGWASSYRATAQPLVWFHAASVGEGLQAAPVLARLRRRHPGWQFGLTYFSPSAGDWIGRPGDADVADFLPYDRPAAVETALDALAPAALIYTKLDVWPELTVRAARRGIPVGLIAGTVRPGSARTRWPVRPILRPAYALIAAAGAVSPPDAERLARLGVPPGRIEILGDPRYDGVVERTHDPDSDAVIVEVEPDARTLVAGSTWPPDEAVLLGAFVEVRARHPDARLVLAPHEPTPGRLAGLEQEAATRGLPTVRLHQARSEGWAILLVDRVGVLARLYGAGGAAYVGGGFGHAGLHSVLEPAAWSLPVSFGPRWRESRDAALLQEADAAIALPPERSAAAALLAQWWFSWLEHPAARETQGRRARGVVEGGLGAADRAAALVERLVSGSGRLASL